MKDKEQILMMIVTRIIPRVNMNYHRNKDDWAIERNTLGEIKMQKGDLVFANSSIEANDFMVGFFDSYDKEKGCAVIREIGGRRR